jgi:hypothetical protein
MTVLDGFRRARNLADYEGAEVEEAKARECPQCAEARSAVRVNIVADERHPTRHVNE